MQQFILLYIGGNLRTPITKPLKFKKIKFMAIKNFNTDYFLKEEHVQKAYDLVKAQIDEKSNVFKTIELEIYRRDKVLNNFNVKNYHQELISKDIFYNKRKIFYNLKYLVPKGFYGVRNFDFLSFDLLILYYSLGFYFSDLIEDSYKIIEEKKDKRKNIFTFYGGKINFQQPANSVLLYYKDYIEFNNSVNEQIKKIIDSNKKAVIIKLDIQEFYKNIDFDILIQIIEKYAVPSQAKKFKFDTTTIQEIKNLFLFLNKSDIGLPLFSQNIISNFLSYIYLYELDNYIQNLAVAKEKDFVYSRYVDDFYIIYKRNKGISNEILGDEIFDISTGISKFLAVKLDARINQLKTQNLIIKDDDDLNNFIKKEKIISLPDAIKKDATPEEKLTDILDIIAKLKKDYKTQGKAHIDTDGNNKLNEIFSKSLNNYVNSATAKKKIEKQFKNWNPLLTLANTSTLMFLITQSSANDDFIKYLFEDIESKFSNPQHLYLLEKFILNNTITSYRKNKINNAQINNSYLKLIKKLVNRNFEFEQFNSLDLNLSDEILRDNDSLCQQVKMLVLSEIDGKYNVAFNHLLNVFHNYCFIVDEENTVVQKKYNQKNVTDFLDRLDFPIDYLNFSIQFFDRRNKNNISHPGEDNMENWVVNKQEFLIYKEKMNELLILIDECLEQGT